MVGAKKKRKRAYHSSRRDAEREATRAAIVAAAARLLRHAGWAGFSVEAVARAADVTRLTVYHQFGERRALLEAVFDREAAHGGLSGIPNAMQLDSPHASLAAVAEIFCAFWASSGAMHGVLAASMADPELAVAIDERNQRRRQLLAVIVARLVECRDVPPARVPALVDTLFALTSFAFYAELTGAGLARVQACATVAELAAAAVQATRRTHSGRDDPE